MQPGFNSALLSLLSLGIAVVASNTYANPFFFFSVMAFTFKLATPEVFCTYFFSFVLLMNDPVKGHIFLRLYRAQLTFVKNAGLSVG